MGISIDIQLLDGGIEPKYQTEGSAGMDLCCTEAFELQPMERRAVPTGVKISLPEGFEAQVRPGLSTQITAEKYELFSSTLVQKLYSLKEEIESHNSW